MQMVSIRQYFLPVKFKKTADLLKSGKNVYKQT